MAQKPKIDRPVADDELFIQLDVRGLAALLKAVEAAMTKGRGHLTLRRGSGLAISSGPSNPFSQVTVTFVDPPGPSDDDERTGQPDPEPQSCEPILEMQS